MVALSSSPKVNHQHMNKCIIINENQLSVISYFLILFEFSTLISWNLHIFPIISWFWLWLCLTSLIKLRLWESLILLLWVFSLDSSSANETFWLWSLWWSQEGLTYKYKLNLDSTSQYKALFKCIFWKRGVQYAIFIYSE